MVSCDVFHRKKLEERIVVLTFIWESSVKVMQDAGKIEQKWSKTEEKLGLGWRSAAP